ncbi:HD-GYP domain-containing protein [Paenibacillus aestuarii]|uniref:HD-GYP domain-containing protein n=1 Tax=Paenibacillus aestuarii TaxID=516965 RepID=A0ABW0K7Q6_9BACL|nr:HD-GYP domain-containing protein [Paenibacillus aestuarii]
MRLVHTSQLRSGLVVARPVYNENGSVLLGRGVALTDRMIERLRGYGIVHLYIEDRATEGIQPEDVITERTRNFAITTVYDTMTKMMSDTRRSNKQAIFPYQLSKQFKDIIQMILDELNGNSLAMLSLSNIFSKDSYLYHHSVNVAITCITMGISLGLNKPQLIDLGIGAILHDIGKVSIPLSILNKPGKLTPEEWELMLQHPMLGFDILRKSDDISLLSAHVALQHHEKEDGSGYPRQLVGDQMHLYGKIAAIADVYEALTAQRSYKPALPPHEAVEYIMGNGGRHFNYDLVKLFCKHMSPYPIGATVQLSSGERGVVSQVNPTNPLRPLLRIIENAGQETLASPYELDLSVHLTAQIV